jgi:DNA-binding transcriptional ArsR family regulator
LIERVASATEIAYETGDLAQSVSNHLRPLREADAIEVVKTERRGPVEEVYYRATRRPELTHEEWLALSYKQKEELAVMSVRNLFAESLAAVDGGTMMYDEEMYWWWKAAQLDPQGREELRRAQDEHVARVLEIEASSNARLVQAGDCAPRTPTVIAVLGFNRARPNPVNEIVQHTS